MQSAQLQLLLLVREYVIFCHLFTNKDMMTYLHYTLRMHASTSLCLGDNITMQYHIPYRMIDSSSFFFLPFFSKREKTINAGA